MEQCQIDGCKQPAKFALYKTLPEKVWLQVCDAHEKEIGRENLKRAGGYVYRTKTGELADNRGLIK